MAIDLFSKLNSIPKDFKAAMTGDYGELVKQMAAIEPAPQPSGVQKVPVSQTAQVAQVAQEPEQSFYSKIAQAFNNPGFRAALAQIGAALAPQGSTERAVGETVSQMNKGQAYADYIKKVTSGEKITEKDLVGLSPEDILSANKIIQSQQGLQLEKQKESSLEKYREGALKAQGTPEERGVQQRLNIITKALLTPSQSALKAPTVKQFYDNEGNLIYKQWNPETQSWDTIATGTTQHPDEFKTTFDIYKEAVRNASNDPRFKAFGTLVYDPESGTWNIKTNEPEKAKEVLNQLIAEYMQKIRSLQEGSNTPKIDLGEW